MELCLIEDQEQRVSIDKLMGHAAIKGIIKDFVNDKAFKKSFLEKHQHAVATLTAPDA